MKVRRSPSGHQIKPAPVAIPKLTFRSETKPEEKKAMRIPTILFLVLTIFAGSALTVTAQEPAGMSGDSLTLEQAIEIALKNNRSVKNAKLEAEKGGDQVAALKTRRLPGIKLDSLLSQPLSKFETTFTKGTFGTYSGIGPVPSEDTVITSSMKPNAFIGAQVTQPLSQLHRIKLQIKQLEVSRQISQTEISAQEQTIVNEVKRAYYAILQTQGSKRAAEEAVKLHKELDRVTGEYVLQQVALKTDQMEVQTKLAKAEYDVLTLSNQLSSQKEQLNHLLGRDVSMDFTVSDSFETAQVMMRETDLVQARQRALEQRPEIREARLKIESAKLDRRVKKSEYIPDVSLAYNYVSTFSYSNFLPRSVSSVGVQVEWEVFDWGRRKNELKEKERTISQADNALQEAQSQVLLEVNSKYRKLQESCQLVRVARLAQTAARANVQMVAYKYRLEAVLLKDVLHAQTSLADADSDYQNALLSFWTAKADFEKALGEDK